MSKWRPCLVPGCERPSRKHGLCNAHWERVKAHGDARGGEPIRRKKNRKVKV